MTVSETLHSLEQQLRPVSADYAMVEAEVVLEHLLNCTRSQLYLIGADEVSAETGAAIRRIAARRMRREPLPYILDSAFFYTREFTVTPDVLIPRPDTEALVEAVLAGEDAAPRRVVDVGTGAGVLAAIFQEQRPAWRMFATDISRPALRIARENCGRSIPLVCGDMLSFIKELPLFDVLVSNPPYVSRDEFSRLEPDVTDYEPRVALDGGPDGLRYYRVLASDAGPRLTPGGRIYCEIGFSQKESACEIFARHGWREIRIVSDNAGRPRVLQAHT
jgi:release factor glutamine methyltransferase